MANDGQIVFEVTADGKHAIADIKDITAAIQKESKKWDDAAEESTDNISNSFNGMLKKIVAGFSAVKIGKALLDIGKDALEAASALNEVQNVVDVTFGSDSNKINQWAKEAGTQFGLTETKAKQFASTLGAMMKSSGVASEEIVDMSTSLAGLAADMSSFYNLDFDEAFQKIRSGISGETEPLKQLGINMSVANLEAFALSKNITKSFNDMSQGEQTMLRYQYLMQATADAQGDFARTSDGYANSLRQLESNIESIKTALGQSFIKVAEEATSYLNNFLSILTQDESEKRKTVLDDFAEIKLQTEEKLESIRQTASEAQGLTSVLNQINTDVTNRVGSNVNKLIEDLGKINLDQSKAGIVKDFIATLADNIGVVSQLTGNDAQGVQDWLTNVGQAADSLDPNDAQGWETLLTSIRDGLPGLENTEFGANFFGALMDGFGEIESETSLLDWVMSSLGDNTNRTAEEQALWLETCKRLVQTIPGLSSIINTETGEVKGGTQAIMDYVDAWQAGQEKIARMKQVQAMEDALGERESALAPLQLDVLMAENAVKKQRDILANIYKKYGIAERHLPFGYLLSRDLAGNASVNLKGNVIGFGQLPKAVVEEINNAAMKYNELEDAAEEATKAYNKQKTPINEAREAVAELREEIEAMPDAIDGAAESTENWLEKVGKTSTEINTLVVSAKEALSTLADYAESVRESAFKAVDSVASGLDKVDYKKFDAISEKISDLTAKMVGMEVGSDEWTELSKQIEQANEELVSTNKIYSNLESQSAFLSDYLANLEAAQRMGLSNELLSSLADGSVESAQYLDALVNDKTGKTAQEIDQLYQDVQQKKAQLAGALSNQQLTVDQVYQQMAADAKAAVEALDLEEDAGNNSAKTVEGIATGIRSKVPDVADAVDAILAQLNRLEGWGISIDLGNFGSIPVNLGSSPSDSAGRGKFTYIASNEKGLETVPFDGYLSVLHAGEAILTAEEARVWRSFKGGIGGTDYDALGGVMRDNIKAGGNVYLDGRIVGSVISDQQGRSYRQLQRSGWQA